MRMRDLRLLVAAAVLSPAVGCNWMREWRDQQGLGRPTGKLDHQRPAGDFVTFLNDRSARLKSVEYGDVRMRVSGKDLPFPVTMDGSMAAAQPRYFRMKCGMKFGGASMDMGSNPEQFWAHVTVPNEQPLVIAASHADFERGRVQMPNGLPFEPDWVLQALGMTRLEPGNAYDVVANDREQTYTLGWTAPGPAGVPVRKEIVIDAVGATGTRSQVKRHILRDGRDQKKVIATAEIRSAQTFRVGQNDRGEPLAGQYPTHIVLRWEEPRFEMDLQLERASVNTGIVEDPSRRMMFVRPAAPGR